MLRKNGAGAAQPYSAVWDPETVNSAQLLRALRELTAQIRTLRGEGDVFPQREYAQAEPDEAYRERQLFSEILAAEWEPSKQKGLEKKYGFSLDANYYRVCLFAMRAEMGKTSEYSSWWENAGKRVCEAAAAVENAYCFRRAEEGWAFLILADTRKIMEKRTELLSDRLRSAAEKCPGGTYFGGIGSCAEGIRELPDSFAAAQKAMAGRFLGRQNQILTAEELSAAENMEENFRVTCGELAGVIEKARQVMTRDYMKKLSLDSVAEQVGMSPSYFSAVFKRETGRTFVEYLTEIRMRRAKELLKGSAMRTSEVGFEVGYKEPHYFSAVFKKTVGCSPKSYRNRQAAL